MNEIKVDETKVWNVPYSTPMMNDAFRWAMKVIGGGHTGGVLYAPTRTGKTKTIELLVEDLKKFNGPRGNSIESETLWVIARDRLVMSEGGFWDWLLHEFHHHNAGTKGSPIKRRQLVCEFLKSLARRSPSGRLVIFVDEAQILELTELGWFADLFNEFQRDGFEMILILVGSYHLMEWIGELMGKRHEHVRSRFFANEHRLTGLRTLTDFRRCLRRFDVDKLAFNGECSFTEYYIPEWFSAGGRLEKQADLFREGFKAMSIGKDFEVPMAYFIRAVRHVLNHAEQDGGLEKFKIVVKETGFLTVKKVEDEIPA